MSARPHQRGRCARLAGAPAFTLTELLVVILIIVAILLIAIPAFSSLVYSSESTMAEAMLRSAIRAGRDAAVRSTGRNDSAIVFFFEPGGRTTLVPCVKVGEIDDIANPVNATVDVVSEIFVASDTLEPVQLPKNWMVRGYAPVNSILQGAYGRWYDEPQVPMGRPHRGPVSYGASTTEGDWVFPETGFYSVDDPAGNVGADRQTFMLRFQAGTGLLTTSSSRPALVLAPRPSAAGRPNAPQMQFQRADLATNQRRWVERMLTDNSMARITRQNFIGAGSSDMVTVKPVAQIALYDEKRLAASLGVRIDGETGCLYAQNGTPALRYPIWVDGVTPGRVNLWIEGATGPGNQPEARIFSIDRYTGGLRRVEVQP